MAKNMGVDLRGGDFEGSRSVTQHAKLVKAGPGPGEDGTVDWTAAIKIRATWLHSESEALDLLCRS
jgi:hypothetical protein